jgi:hypothetical protein
MRRCHLKEKVPNLIMEEANCSLRVIHIRLFTLACCGVVFINGQVLIIQHQCQINEIHVRSTGETILMEYNHTQRKTFPSVPGHPSEITHGLHYYWIWPYSRLANNSFGGTAPQSSITTLCLTIPHHLLLSLMVNVMWLCHFTSCDPPCITNNQNCKNIILHFSRMIKYPITSMMRDVCGWHVVGWCWYPQSLPRHIPT